MSNWLGIQAQHSADLDAACGATEQDFAALRTLSEDDPLLRLKFDNCMVSARVDALHIEEQMQEKYDDLVLGCTLLVALVLISLIVVKFRRRMISALETGIIEGSTIAIKGKRRVQNYGSDLKTRIDEKINQKP